MRLSEIRKKLHSYGVTSKVNPEIGPLHSFTSSETLAVLRFLSKFDWIPLDFSYIQDILDEKYLFSMTGSQSERVRVFIAKVNGILPFFMALLNEYFDDQPKYAVNIKLSQTVTDIEGLAEMIDKIKKLETYTNLSGERFKFTGFDKGSDWIGAATECCINGVFMAACLKLAYDYFKKKKDDSADSKLSYKASLKDDEKETKEGYDEFIERRCQIHIKEEAGKIATEIGEVKGRTQSDICNCAIKATKFIISLHNEGNEVHPSLNPSKEVARFFRGEIEVGGLIEKKEVKQISAPKSAKAVKATKTPVKSTPRKSTKT